MATRRVVKKSLGFREFYIWEAFEEFYAEKEATNRSLATLRNYKKSLELFCRFNDFGEDTPLSDVEQNHFYKWINSMKLDGVSPASINHYLRDLRTFFYWCMDADRVYIEIPFKIQMISGQEEPPKLFSEEDIELLLEKPRRNDSFVDWRTWAIVNWVLATGNRAATICEVRLNDIDFREKEITLLHTKNKKAQIIPMSSSLETVLKEYTRFWRKEAPKGGWLFPNIGEEQLTTNALRHSFRRYCLSRGVEQTNIHGLRHSFAKGWVQNNGNMFTLQKLLGHSTLEMTRKYVKLYSEDIKDDFDKFNPLDTMKRNTKRTQTIKRGKDF